MKGETPDGQALAAGWMGRLRIFGRETERQGLNFTTFTGIGNGHTCAKCVLPVGRPMVLVRHYRGVTSEIKQVGGTQRILTTLTY